MQQPHWLLTTVWHLTDLIPGTNLLGAIKMEKCVEKSLYCYSIRCKELKIFITYTANQ